MLRIWDEKSFVVFTGIIDPFSTRHFPLSIFVFSLASVYTYIRLSLHTIDYIALMKAGGEVVFFSSFPLELLFYGLLRLLYGNIERGGVFAGIVMTREWNTLHI